MIYLGRRQGWTLYFVHVNMSKMVVKKKNKIIYITHFYDLQIESQMKALILLCFCTVQCDAIM